MNGDASRRRLPNICSFAELGSFAESNRAEFRW